MKALMKTTKSASPATVEKKWVLIDAEGLVVGRAASIIANILRGKHKPSFTPHVDCGDNVIVINADEGEVHRQEVGRQGLLQAHRLCGRHQGSHRAKVLEGRFPERVLEKAVERMIPRGPLGRQQMRNLRIFRRSRASARRPEPGSARSRFPQPQEQGGCIMSDTVNSLSDLQGLTAGADTAASAAAPVATQSAPLRQQELDKQGRAYATGRRKDAVARVWVKPGTGKITVNGRDQETYFARPTLRSSSTSPSSVADREGQYDVIATVKGGGLSGQAGAVKHGIAQALTNYEPGCAPRSRRRAS
jgi:ribosomal protein L13